MSRADDSIVSMIAASRLYPPDEHRTKKTHAGSVAEFHKMLARSWEDPDAFWAEVASELKWMRRWDSVQKGHFPDFEFFSGGIANPCENLLDRHLELGADNRLALIWEGENFDTRFFTYRMLFIEVCKFANALKTLGIGKGDAVCIFLPNLPETLIAVLACYRLGAIFNTVFSGFSATALRSRIVNLAPKLLITVDGSYRRGKVSDLKSVADEAIQGIESIEHLIVVKRTGTKINMATGRDLWWDEVIRGASTECPAEPLEANEPGLVFYTSGTSGKPKGVVHSGTAFVVNNYLYSKYQMDHHPNDVLWCTADIGWLTMHIWGIAGALANGVTTIFFEGAVDFPGPRRFYEVIEKYRVNKLFTAPTAIRMLMKHGEELARERDISSLEVIGLVGEPLNPEAWNWLNDKVLGGKVCINNTWGQTELSGCPIAGAAWLSDMKPGSCGSRFFAADLDIVDDEGNPVPDNVTGNLIIRKPFPMMARTLWKEPERYVQEYFTKVPGCYFTYDAAIRDTDGHYWVVGRLDDVINVAGHRLSTMEIESAIMCCVSVAETAVIGVADATKGLVPVAFVTLKAGTTASSTIDTQIRLAVETQISKIAIPARVFYANALPKTPSGKILRRMLREIVESGEVQGDVTGLADVGVVQELIEIVKSSR
jgi:acetyl-CoA synthetase